VDARGRTHCGIIYCLSRNDAETLAGKLAELPQPRQGRNGGRLQVT
jgi:superfamily II DNA helicase RecQ